LANRLFDENYMTMLIGIFDNKSGVFEYINAGHPPLIMLDPANKHAEVVKDDGPLPIGWKLGNIATEFEINSINFDSNKIFFLYTDGIFECANTSGELLEISGLINIIENLNLKQDSIAAPFLIKEALLSKGYNLSTDDFMIMSIIPILMKNNTSHFSLYPRLNYVAGIAQSCEELVQGKGYSEQLAIKVELAITELLNNIITHGNLTIKEKITILLKHENDIQITVWDKGDPWEIENSINKLHSPMAESGRGLKIINDLSSDFSVVRYGDINEVTIVISENEN
jgi:anti-sigma regulatory factor (Ser/Thr protein kinase)